MFAGVMVLLSSVDANASASIVTVPLLLLGAGIGGLASQLGSVTVSAVPDSQSPEVGGLQNTATNIGASLGTALAGSVLLAVLSSAFLTGLQQHSDVRSHLSEQASVQLVNGIPFVSDADLKAALEEARIPPKQADAIVEVNANARLEALQASLAVIAGVALLALFFAGGIPTRQPTTAPPEPESDPDPPI
jgi:hypothetical protein